MPLPTKTRTELNALAFEFLRRTTDGKVTLLNPGSTARALVEANNAQIEGVYDSLSLHQAMAYLSTASGIYLDLIADLFGMSRRPPRAAALTQQDGAIRFYVTTGTLYDRLPKAGDLNRGLIPAGTTISSTDNTVIYTVESDVTFPRVATEVFVPARAAIASASSNVGANVLRSHSLGVSGVYVTNPISIVVNTDAESDDEFRARIHLRVRSSQGANEASIRLAALSAPGVADVKLVPYLMGAGSFDVLLVPAGNRISKEALEVAKLNVAEAVAFGTYYRIREPVYVRFSMVLTITPKAGLLSGEINAVRASAERAVLNYVGNLRMGDSLVINQLGNAILTSDNRIKDYDIQALCVNGKPQVLHSYQLAQDELFLPDENLQDPVRVL